MLAGAQSCLLADAFFSFIDGSIYDCDTECFIQLDESWKAIAAGFNVELLV